jgi:MbtH protein
MQRDEAEDDTVYVVVVNHEEQYSIWPEVKPVPAGWRAAGQRGSKAECLSFIGRVWTDMTPASLRQ